MGERAYYWVPTRGTGQGGDDKGNPSVDAYDPDIPEYSPGAIMSVIKHDIAAGKMLIMITTPAAHDTPPKAEDELTHTDVTSLGFTKHEIVATKGDGSDVYGGSK